MLWLGALQERARCNSNRPHKYAWELCVCSPSGDLRVWKYCILCAENDRWECAPVLVCTVPAVYDRSVYCGPIEGLCTPKKGCDDEWLPNVDDFGA